MKKLLVPCDFSPCSKEALKFALDLREMMHASINVVYVSFIPSIFIPNFSEGVPMGYYENYCRSLEEEALRKYQLLLDELDVSNDVPSFRVIYGEVPAGIVNEAEKCEADFIIMGASGTSEVMTRFFGTVTQKVVQYSEIPVFGIHNAIKPAEIKNILLPSPLTLDQGEFLTKVQDLQKLFDARLHVLLVNTPANFWNTPAARTALETFVDHYQLENYVTHFYSFETEEGGIADFALKENIDLLLMGTHARKGLSHFLAGSITDEVFHKINCPIVTYHLRKEYLHGYKIAERLESIAD